MLIDTSTSINISKAVLLPITTNYRKVFDKIMMLPMPVSDNVTRILKEHSYSVSFSISGNSEHRQKEYIIFSQTFNALLDYRSSLLEHSNLLLADLQSPPIFDN